MCEAVDRKYFAGLLGWTALVADVITIGQFITSSGFQSFWSFHWIISIVFIVGLFGAGLGLLTVAGSPKSAKFIMGVFGAAYIFVAALLYIFWGYQQIQGVLDFGDYAGFALLFAVATGISLASIGSISKEYLRFPSYAFGITNALYLFLVIQKYVFEHASFQWDYFIGEALILVVGAFLFLSLFFGSEKINLRGQSPLNLWRLL